MLCCIHSIKPALMLNRKGDNSNYSSRLINLVTPVFLVIVLFFLLISKKKPFNNHAWCIYIMSPIEPWFANSSIQFYINEIVIGDTKLYGCLLWGF